jgi:hypothetical protein
MFADAEDGKGGAVMFTKTLADEVMKDETNFSELERHMDDAFNRSLDSIISSYVRFTKCQPSDIPWPDISMESFRNVFSPPKIKKLIQIFHNAFDLIFPYLQRDLFSRVPGKSIKMDGTFQFLKKTRNDEQSSGKNTCLNVVWGEYGHVLSWAFDSSENAECFQRLNFYLRKRCEILGESPKNVRAAFSDTCCQGLKNPEDHWITDIWPGCKRAPHKDIFHALKKISGATQPHHESSPL